MATTEIIYLGRDNAVALLLKAEGVAVDLSGVTRIDLKIGSTVITSIDRAAGSIRWAQQDYQTGEVRIFPAGITGLEASALKRIGYLVVYDATNEDGLVWGELPLKVVSV